MAEEFGAGICGGTWWNSARCSAGIAAADMGSLGLGWGTEARSREESNNINSANYYDSSIVFPAAHQTPDQQAYSSDSGDTGILIDSTLQMMGFGLSSSTTSDHWNQPLLSRSNARNENYNSILEEDDDDNLRLSCGQETGMDSSQDIHKDWSPKSYTNTSPGEESSITTSFKPINHQNFSLEKDRLNISVTSSGDSRPTSCQSLSAGFPLGLGSTCTAIPYGYPSTTLLQSLFESDPQTQQQNSLFNNRSINNYMSTVASTDGTNGHELWPKLAPFVKQQPSGLHFSNNTPFWNASATGINDDKAGFLPSQQSQFLVQEKPNCPSLKTKTNAAEEVRNSGSVMKKGSSTTTTEPPLKRPRIETPSSLPTFKVRKEKLGDRITALQQLVSPFGKTDTASVLHEAIEYIKFLHDQVNVLSTPYMKQAETSIQQKQSIDMVKDPEEGPKQDLRSRGLCLVPISSTFPVANDNTADFWTPAFGGGFR